MTTISINCIDKISLSLNEKFYFVSFYILEKYKYNNEKIKEFCINKINEMYNPKYPFYFMKIKDVIQSISCDINIIDGEINVELYPKKHLFYKLKLVGLCINPVYCLCLDTYIFSDIIDMLYLKYPVCCSGVFIYNNLKLQINESIKKCNFKINEINEIECVAGNNFNIGCSVK